MTPMTYEKQADERFEQKQEEFMTFRRPHGMAMSAYVAKLRRLKSEYLKEDVETRISDRAYAQRLLTRAGLSKKERTEVFFAAGGRYRSDAIERVLKFRCATLHTDEVEKYRYGKTHADLRHRSRRVYKQSGAKSSTWKKKRHEAHLTEAEPEDEEEPDEDFEEEEDDDDLDREDLEQEAYPADVRDDQEWWDDEGRDWQEGEWEDEDEWNMTDLRDAYTAGWRARQQSSEARKGRGYKGQGKGKKTGKGKERPPDNRSVEDRKKSSKCAACHRYGHWKGDAICPKTKSGEVPERKTAKQEPQETLFTSGTEVKDERPKEEDDSPECGAGGKKLTVNRVNWTFMVNSGSWDVLKSYDSSESESSSEEEPPPADPLHRAMAPATASAGIEEKPKKHRIKLKAVMQALSEVIEDEDERRRLRKAQRRRKKSKKSEEAEMAVDTQELLGILPHLTKDEKRSLLKQLLAEEEDEAAKHVPTLAEFPKPKHKGGYRQAEPERANLAASSRASLAASSARRSSASSAASEAAADDVPIAVKKKRLEEFRRQLYTNALNSKGRLRLSEASDVPNANQDQCTHDYTLLKWGANGSAHWADCTVCKLKKVLYWSKMHGSLMAVQDEPPETMELILDTGCRTAVAGSRWHERFQKGLLARGLM